MSRTHLVAHLRARIITEAASKKQTITIKELEDFTIQGLLSTCLNRGIVISDDFIGNMLHEASDHDTRPHLDIRIIEKVPMVYKVYVSILTGLLALCLALLFVHGI